jgi:predicted O-linked N-acetylglucosamine transferase (SPINDLY family)
MNDLFSSELDDLLARLTTLLEANNYASAAEIGAEALPRFPKSAELLRIYAITLHQLGRPKEALPILYRAEKINPDGLEIQCNLATLETASDRADEAVERMRASLRLVPGHPVILLTLGNALMAAGRYSEARDSYAMATYGAPAHPGLRLNVAAAELELGHPEQSAVHAGEALQLVPQMGAAYAMLGHSHRTRRQFAEASQAYLRAEELEPSQGEHAYYAGLMLDDLGELQQAEAAYARALERNPGLGAALSQRVFTLRRLCEWPSLEMLSARLRVAVAEQMPGITPFGFLAEEATAAEQRRCAETFAAGIEKQMAPLRRQLDLTHFMPPAGTPIRVGFVSNGFGDHATGLLMVAMLEALGSSDLDVHLYATALADGSVIRRRLEAACKAHDVANLTEAELARRIHADQIELLVDLTVYSSGSNARLFALRPAPLQLNWLGYPGTSGAPWMDYLLADHIVQPDHLRADVSEKVVRLPRCYQPTDTTRVFPQAPTREQCGLPAQGTVFACFNASYKINPQSFNRFLSILAQTPESVLWLLGGVENADERMRTQAQEAGIDPGRLVFMARLPHAQYLARYEHVDLFLDTLPYNAHTTASDALWAGCPVLTLIGETFAGRVAASLLHHVGLPEMITETEDGFVALAVSLGSHQEALQLLRQHLKGQRATGDLFDMPGYASDFRRAVQAMVARRRIGRPIADIDIA